MWLVLLSELFFIPFTVGITFSVVITFSGDRSDQFSSECLPPIEVSDLLSYLVLETSYYINKQFKAFRSSEAYNQMVSGFVTSVQPEGK